MPCVPIIGAYPACLSMKMILLQVTIEDKKMLTESCVERWQRAKSLNKRYGQLELIARHWHQRGEA